MYSINIPQQEEQELGLVHALYLELVEPKQFEVQEEEAKEEHVDPEPGMQLEDVEVDWDTGKKLDSVRMRNTQVYYINIP